MNNLTIYKYLLRITDSQKLTIPVGAKPMHVAMQDGLLYLWALVDPEKASSPLDVFIKGTGHPIDPIMATTHNFAGTVLTDDFFVWHVFVEKQ